jgi:ArsR family transcriptional regulator
MDRKTFLRITKALGDGRRLEILDRIAAAKGEISCVDVRTEIHISKTMMSHHIKELVAAGLIETRRESRYQYLRMQKKAWHEYLKCLRNIGSEKRSQPRSRSPRSQ